MATQTTTMKSTKVPTRKEGPETTSESEVPTNLLMISNKRHRAFYERAARELLASGHEVIQLSALGEAVPLAIQLANTLQDKQAASVVKIETKLVEFVNTAPTTQGNARRGSLPMRAAGISMTLARHPDFKGTRIVPGFVFFCPEKPTVEGNVAYPVSPDRVFASVNSGYRGVEFDTQSTGKAFTEILEQAGHDLAAFKTLHEYLLTEALVPNKGQTDMKSISFVGELDAVKKMNSGLKAAFCRVCPKLKEIPGKAATGAVFLHVFADGKYPHNNENNSCMIHVVAPKAEDFPDAADFLEAVSLTATNLMTALCDFNGYAKRYHGEPRLRRLGVVRIPLFSGEQHTLHPKTTRADVAKALLKGLNEGYHFGPAPRLNFADVDGIFKKIWMDATGQPESALQTADGSFRRPTETENK